jgi:magnesium transporter
MTIEDRFEEVRALLDADRPEAAAALLAQLRVQDVAALLMQLDDDEIAATFRRLSAGHWADVFSYLDDYHQQLLLSELSDDEKRHVLSGLVPDDLTALLEELPDDRVKGLLRLLSFRDVRRALKLLGYPEDSVGRLMTPDFVAVRLDQTIAEALTQIRAQIERYETVNVVFVLDDDDRLVNIIPLKRFILGRPEDPLSTLVSGSVVSIEVTADREDAVRRMQHYDLSVLPVVDADQHLLGIVTVDDVLDVAEEEATEDFHKLGSVGAVNLSLRDARPALLYRKRIGWLLVLVLVNVLSGAAIAMYENAIEALVVLVFFLPLVIASGGNAGAQSATLMVRALATGDVQMRDWLRLWGKELGVAVALGATMGAAVSIIGVWRGGPEVGLVVAIAMVLVVVVGSMMGMLMPFLLARFNVDPATASTPLITSIADIAGILIYFSVATALLDLPIGMAGAATLGQ